MFDEFLYHEPEIENEKHSKSLHVRNSRKRSRSQAVSSSNEEGKLDKGVNMRHKGGIAASVSSFDPIVMINHDDPSPHTLRTMPSEKSLARQLTSSDIKLRGGSGPQNYGHPRNCFFNIVGSCCNFRRDETPYEVQLSKLTAKGFAVWDVLKKCIRPGSLDSSIDQSTMEPNDIPGLLEDYPTIRRLVFPANSAKVFAHTRAFASWLNKGIANKNGKKTLKKYIFYYDRNVVTAKLTKDIFDRKRYVKEKSTMGNVDVNCRSIELVVLPSTSPASAKMRPPQKEKLWHMGCFLLMEPPASYSCPGCNLYHKGKRSNNHWFADCTYYDRWKAKRRSIGKPKPHGGDAWYY